MRLGHSGQATSVARKVSSTGERAYHRRQFSPGHSVSTKGHSVGTAGHSVATPMKHSVAVHCVGTSGHAVQS